MSATLPNHSAFSADAKTLLAELQTALRARGLAAELDSGLAVLSTAVDRLVREHDGMSRELIATYEQLGVVFEVSRRLPSVRSERKVVDLFLDSLRRTFHRHQVFAADRGAANEWRAADGKQSISKWLADLLGRSMETARVMVEPCPLAPGGAAAVEVMVAPVFAGDVFVCAMVLVGSAETARFQASDMGLLQSLNTFCGDLIRSHRLVNELRAMSVAMIRALVNAVDQKDEYTSGHSVRVAYYATLLGRELDLRGTDLQMLQWSALLHDVGKIGIRDDVLKKAGKLTAEEFEHMKEHPVRSHRVVQQVPQLANALDGVLYHHERFDGKGYPMGLAGEAIPRQARVVQIGDMFDALTSNRSYRAAHSWSQALSIMADEAGKAIDPHLQSVFDRLIRDRAGGESGSWLNLVWEAERFVADAGSDTELEREQ